MTENDQKKYAAEAILFAAGEAVEGRALAAALDCDIQTVRDIMEELSADYENRGINLIQVGEAYQFCTNADYFESIKKMYQAPKRKTLSNTLVETLAVIAYRQPVTKAYIAEIRGVNADHAVNKLVEYGLVEEVGRLDAPGRPIQFGTTDEFLRYFNYKTLDYMPPMPESSEQLEQETRQEVNNMSN